MPDIADIMESIAKDSACNIAPNLRLLLTLGASEIKRLRATQDVVQNVGKLEGETPEMTARERIARLLLESTWQGRFPWEDEDDASREVYLRNADALIAAGFIRLPLPAPPLVGTDVGSAVSAEEIASDIKDVHTRA